MPFRFASTDRLSEISYTIFRGSERRKFGHSPIKERARAAGLYSEPTTQN